MRSVAALVAFSICAAAQASAAPPQQLDNPAYSDPAKKWTSIKEVIGTDAAIEIPESLLDAVKEARECNDTITKARAEAGLPLLKRKPASPEEPHLIYAVDRREGGCSVMVMKGNPQDVRPLPAPMKGPLEVIPAQKAK